VNTVLASIAAKAFKEFADAIEKGATPKSVAQKALKDSWKVSQIALRLFNRTTSFCHT
jgi:hypothetical protein